MNDVVWLMLVKCINEFFSCGDVDGIVIIYGIDIMEEIVFFLNLIVKSDKFVVLVGVMCFFMVMSVDGLLNLYNVVVIVVVRELWGKGVVIVMNGLILGVYGVMKINMVDV